MKLVKVYTLKENIVSCYSGENDINSGAILYSTSCDHSFKYVSDGSVLNMPHITTTRVPIQKFVKYTGHSCEEIYIAIDPEIEKLIGLSDLKSKVFEKQQIVNDLNNQILISKKSLVATKEKLILQFKLMTFWQRLIFLVTTRLPNFK